MRKSSKRRKRQSRVGKIAISCIVILLAVILSVQIVRLSKKNEEYKAQQEQLQAELEEEQQRQKDLEEEEEYVGSDEYVEDVAKSKLGMVYPDEIIFKEEK